MKLVTVLLVSALCIPAHAARRTKRVPPPVIEHSILVLNKSTNQYIFQRNSNTVRSIASITKLMTAMVVLDQLPNPATIIKLAAPYLGRKDYTVTELLQLLLVRSDNHVAEILSKNFLGTRVKFIEAMNTKAASLGMSSAAFTDPSGLDNGNLATAGDVAKLIMASGTYPDIRAASSVPSIALTTKLGKRTQLVNINNTNKTILDEFGNIVVSKTGTTNSAGKCLALLIEQHGQQYAVVIMGETSKLTRDHEARYLIQNHLTVPITLTLTSTDDFNLYP